MRKIKFSRKNKLGQKLNLFFGTLAIILIVAMGFTLFAKNDKSSAATIHSIADVGTITDFRLTTDPAGNNNLTNVGFSSITTCMQISGTIDSSLVAVGDSVTIKFGRIQGSHFNAAASGIFGATLNDGQYSVSGPGTTNGTITLTKKAEGEGTLNFTLKPNACYQQLEIKDAASNISGFYVQGFESTTTFTFTNSPKGQTLQDELNSGFDGYTVVGTAYIDAKTNISRIYNMIQNNKDITQNSSIMDILNGGDYIQTMTLRANPDIVRVYQSGMNYCYLFDMLDDQTGLNNSYNRYYSSGPCSSQILTKTSLSPNLSTNEIYAEMKAKGPQTYSLVKNSDGTWTGAINWGPLMKENSDLAYLQNETFATLDQFPTIPETTAANKNLIQRAIQMGLAAENLRANMFIVDFADPTVSNTARAVLCNNLIDSTTCTERSYTANYSSNAAAGQTGIKVRYVSTDKSAVSAVNTSYGWPTDNQAGENPTASITVSPLAKAPAGYTLVTRPEALQIFANNFSLNYSEGSPALNTENLVTSSSVSVEYPTLASGVPATEIYYVYAPIYNLNFNTNTIPVNQESAVAGPEIASQTVMQDTNLEIAAEPDSPQLEKYIFAGWFTDENFTTEFDFSAPLNANKTAFAKWIPIYSLKFDTNGGNDISEQLIIQNSGIEAGLAPEENPVKTGFTFGGWYSDNTLTKEFDFSAPINSDTVVFAKWLENCQYDQSILSSDKACVAPLTPTAPNTGFMSKNSSKFLVALFAFTVIMSILYLTKRKIRRNNI